MWITYLRRVLFFPFAALYGLMVLVRNVLFDKGWLTSYQVKRPTIVLGNVTVGGTGKTPHTITVLDFLHKKGCKAAFLSRGYGRSTAGFVAISPHSAASEIGDEPLLIARRMPNLVGAVSEKRVDGANTLIDYNPDIEAIVLDDAYQHRQLRGDLYILTTDFNRPFFSDFMLPAGALRDNRREYKRAHIIVVTKCPPDLSDAQKSFFIKKIAPLPHQLICFTAYEYGAPTDLDGVQTAVPIGTSVLGFAGLAVNAAFQKHLKEHFSLKKFKDFPDHHTYGRGDVQMLQRELSTFGSPQSVMITTEKDAVKWMEKSEVEKNQVLFLPIQVKFLHGEKEFYQRIEHFIKTEKK